MAIWTPKLIKPPLGTPIYKGHPLARGLEAYWLMNEGSGNTVYDLSGNGNTGTFVGNTHFVPGIHGPALDFDGSGDYVSIPAAFSTVSGNVTTLVLWAAIDAWDSSGFVIFGTNTGTAVYWQMDGPNDDVYVQNTAILDCGISGFADGVSRQWALVSDGSAVHIYVDGILLGSAGAGTALSAGSKNFCLGDWIGGLGSAFEFNGQLDAALFYARGLSASEVADLYPMPFAMFERPTPELWVSAGEEPPAGTGYVFTIIMSSLPVWLVVGLDIGMGHSVDVKRKAA